MTPQKIGEIRQQIAQIDEQLKSIEQMGQRMVRASVQVEDKDIRGGLLDAVEYQQAMQKAMAMVTEFVKDVAAVCLDNHIDLNKRMTEIEKSLSPVKEAGVFYKYRKLIISFAMALFALSTLTNPVVKRLINSEQSQDK